MSRHYIITIISIGLLFTACSINRAKPNKELTTIKSITPISNEQDLKSLEALMYQYTLDKKSKALDIYKVLYESTGESVYLKEAIKLSFFVDDENSTDKLLAEGIRKMPDDTSVMRYKVSRLLQQKKYKKAQVYMQKLFKKEKSEKNMLAIASIYALQEKNAQALKMYRRAYKKSSSEDSLIKLVLFLNQKMNKKQEAIRNLESHLRAKASSLNLHQLLLQFYGESLNIKGLISTNKLMYKNFKDDEYAKKVINLYMYDKDKQGAIEFLEESGYEPALLMGFYAEEEQFKKAYKVAQKLYKEYGDTQYLGRMAIYEYEAQKGKLTTRKFHSISQKFEKVIEKMHTPLYLNYYGYLLIDHNKDISKGIKYVKMALEKEPDSVYYIDSLGWGYYKQKKCKKALEVMDKIIGKTEEKEIKEHYKLIKKCAKKER